ncbi:MAG TPA: hypothetical protein VNN10_04295 [Dehalococcoidia bacterium]|nr:hypothetical protein [Dehalococcoidia bacterium]
MTATSAFPGEAARQLYIDRRVVTVKPDRIDVHPARSIIFLPLLGLALGISVFPAMYFWGESLSLALRFALTAAAIVIIPVAGMGLVYSIAGAHIVIERQKQSAVLQQGFLGMGVGTQELIPFWKIDKVLVRELTPHDYRGHQEDFAQYEIAIVKVSGKEIPVGLVTVLRAEEKEGLARAREVAAAIAEMCGTKVSVSRAREQKPKDGRR